MRSRHEPVAPDSLLQRAFAPRDDTLATRMIPTPLHRPRRLRRTAAIRRLVRETRLHPADLVLPLFVRPGTGIRTPVGSMPGVAQTSVDECINDARRAHALGLGGIILFGIPDHKDATGTGAWDDEGPVQQAVRAIKREVPELV